MKKLIYLLAVFILSSCQAPKDKTEITYSNITYNQIPKLYEAPTVPLEPYTINIRVDKTNQEQFILEVFMHLYGGSHFVSPHSGDHFKGRFTISIDDNDFVELDKSFEEIPRSKEVHDTHLYVNGLVNWVSVDTKYKHKLHIKTDSNFKVKGIVTFTIEPRCTFEKIPFTIIFDTGEMKIATENC